MYANRQRNAVMPSKCGPENELTRFSIHPRRPRLEPPQRTRVGQTTGALRLPSVRCGFVVRTRCEGPWATELRTCGAPYQGRTAQPPPSIVPPLRESPNELPPAPGAPARPRVDAPPHSPFLRGARHDERLAHVSQKRVPRLVRCTAFRPGPSRCICAACRYGTCHPRAARCVESASEACP